MELWFTELQNRNLKITTRVEETLYHAKSPYQEVLVVKTSQFGNMLALDDIIQTTEADEFVYHELIAHVPMMTHPNPRKVLVIGGGDGGTVREVLKHPGVEMVHLVEIDEEVVKASREFLPITSSKLDDPRVTVMNVDGLKYVEETDEHYDVVIVDSSDPVGPGVGLFGLPFYEGVADILTEDGILVAQTESPFYNQSLLQSCYSNIGKALGQAWVYWGVVPTYPSGFWTFTMGSKKHNPIEVKDERLSIAKGWDLKWYTPSVHKSSFVLPAFVESLLKETENK